MIEINANSGHHNNMIVILPIQAQCMLPSERLHSVDSLRNTRNAQSRLMRLRCKENHLCAYQYCLLFIVVLVYLRFQCLFLITSEPSAYYTVHGHALYTRKYGNVLATEN